MQKVSEIHTQQPNASEGLQAIEELLAACLFHAGRFDDLAQMTAEQPGVCYWQGLGYARQGLLDQAVEKFRATLDRQPQHQPANQALALLLKQLFVKRADAEGWEALLVAGRRQDAMEVLEDAFKRSPQNGALAHGFGLVSYFAARSLETDGDRHAVDDAWRRVIAAWVITLHDEAFWTEWRAQAEKRYRASVSAQDIDALRSEIKEHLVKALSTNSVDDLNAAELGRNGHSTQREPLLQRELRAAALLQEFGGFAWPEAGGKKLVCGPLMIELLGCHSEFGRFVADLQKSEESTTDEFFEFFQKLLEQEPEQTDEGDLSDSTRENRLMRYFSQIGTAQAMLDLSRPREALESLADAACQPCRDTAPQLNQDDASRWRITVCQEDCPRFDPFNPGYAGLQDKGSRIRADAIKLAVEAHLAIAQSEITVAIMNLETACNHWRQAVELTSDSSAKTQRRIVDMAVGRGQALQNGNRFDEAILLLEQAKDVCDNHYESELKGRLAEFIADRGIDASNKNPPQWDESVRDLRRAVEMNPHAVRYRINLCTALGNWADQYFNKREERTAIALLEESIRCATEADSANSNHPELQRLAEEARSGLGLIHNECGLRMADEEDYPGAIEELEIALKYSPNDEVVQDNLKRMCSAYAADLVTYEMPERAAEVLEKALNRFPSDASLQQDLAEVRMMVNLSERRQW